MKKFFFFFCVMAFFLPVLNAQEIVSITLVVECSPLPDNSSIYITGNHEQIGNWKPDFFMLDNPKEGIWSSTLKLDKGKKLEFKITRGSWSNEALNDDGSLPDNYEMIIEKDTSLTIKVNLWADQYERKVEGQITGIVKYHLSIGADYIKPRSVVVWLPPYYFLEEKRYPVLYMHDGQNIFDPNTSAFKVDWQLDETADSLIRKNLIEEIIIVGIYNTADRRSEYSENDTGYAYMRFLTDSLKPFIDKNYRTISDMNNTAIGGSSMGGLISFMLAWEYPDVFSKAICMSPALKYKRFDYVDNVKRYKGRRKELTIYIDNGGDEIDTKIQPGIDEMVSTLKEKGFEENVHFHYYRDKDAKHNESAWAGRIWRALIFLFGTKDGKILLSSD